MIKLSEIRDKLKPDIMGWINQAIASATLSGITVSLPPNVAYTDVEQTFSERQWISVRSTSADGSSIAALLNYLVVSPTVDDAAGIGIGTWGVAYTDSANANDFGNVWGVAGYAQHYGSGLVSNLEGVVGLAQLEVGGGNITNMMGGVFGINILGTGTVNVATGILVTDPGYTGGTPTYSRGIQILNQGNAGVTESIGLMIEPQSGSTTNYALWTQGGLVRFDGVGLLMGTTAHVAAGAFGAISANDALFINDGSTLTSGAATGATSYINGNPGGASSATFIGGLFVGTSLTGNAQNFTGSIRGVTGLGQHDGTATASSVYGAQVSVSNINTGTITKGVGLLVGTFVNSGGGTITGAAGIAMADMAVGTNKTNLLLGTTTIPSGTYNIYAASTLANYFAGDITVQANFTVQQSASFFPTFTVAESTFNVGPQILLRDARGSLGSEAVVVNGSVVGAFLFQGFDGSAYQTAAFISATVNGTPGANDMPGALRFWTTPDGSTTAAERLTILQSGFIGIGDNGPDSGLELAAMSNNGYMTLNEISEPSNPATNKAAFFIKDNGAGKTQLCVRFSSGATQVIATQP